MRVSLFLATASLIFLPDIATEELIDFRRSCATKTIFFKTDYYRSEVVTLQNPGHDEVLWNAAIGYEFDEEITQTLQDKPVGDFLTTLRMIGELRENKKLHRTLVEKLLDVTLIEDLSPEADLEVYRLSNSFPYNLFPGLEFRPEYDTMILKEHSIRDVNCSRREDGSFDIELSFEVMILKKQEVWKCEDIGVGDDTNYEFYYIRGDWMFEFNGDTVYIDETKCSHDIRLCDPHTFYTAVCSVKSIENCGTVSISRKNVTQRGHSNVRTLAGGVAVYGSFQSFTDHQEGETHHERHLDWGLYYLSFTE